VNHGVEQTVLPHLRDVSEWQGLVDWSHYATVAHPHLVGLYYRAGRGPGIRDAQLVRNSVGARRARMHVGAYWYLEPGVGSPELQVDALVASAPHVRGASLRPALDCEDGSPTGKREWYLRAIVRACKRLGFAPTVYGSPSYLEALQLPAWVGRECPLWLADYGVARPELPKPWAHWSAWQYTDSATDPACAGRVDDSLVSNLSALVCPRRLSRRPV
jgi:lysozyme